MRPSDPSLDGRYDLAGWPLVRRLVQLRASFGTAHPRLLELGTGRGRDLIFLARNGFRVTGIDVSSAALERARRRAARLGVPMRLRLADFCTGRLGDRFDVVYSSCALGHVPPELRARRFREFKASTVPGGIHVVGVLSARSRRRHQDELSSGDSPYARDELRGYYSGWEILEAGERPFACRLGPRPHQHVVQTVIARRPR